MWIKTLLLFATLFLSACTFIDHRFGSMPNHNTDGIADYHQALKQLGAPDSIAVLDKHMVFVYQSIHIQEPQLGLHLGNDWIRLNYGIAQAKRQILLMVFDQSGKQVAAGDRDWASTMGDDISLNVVFSINAAVDQSRFQQTRAPLLWGRQLLLPDTYFEKGQTPIIQGQRIEVLGQPL